MYVCMYVCNADNVPDITGIDRLDSTCAISPANVAFLESLYNIQKHIDELYYTECSITFCIM